MYRPYGAKRKRRRYSPPEFAAFNVKRGFGDRQLGLDTRSEPSTVQKSLLHSYDHNPSKHHPHMCRYAFTNYKSHFACLACRKAFKRRHKAEVDPGGDDQPARCPQCGLLMADMGLDFAPPSMSDTKAWTALAALFEVGETFHSCGCGGPGYRPRAPAELAAFFEERIAAYQRHLDGWLRTKAVSRTGTTERTSALKAWRSRIKRLENARAVLG